MCTDARASGSLQRVFTDFLGSLFFIPILAVHDISTRHFLLPLLFAFVGLVFSNFSKRKQEAPTYYRDIGFFLNILLFIYFLVCTLAPLVGIITG